MLTSIEGPITAKAIEVRRKFLAALGKTNTEKPRPQD